MLISNLKYIINGKRERPAAAEIESRQRVVLDLQFAPIVKTAVYPPCCRVTESAGTFVEDY